MSTETAADERYPCQIGVFCDECGVTVTHDYVVSDSMDQLARFNAARAWLTKHEGWLCTPEDDLCRNCRPFPGLLRQAAQFLRDVMPDMSGSAGIASSLSWFADPVAKWLDDVADLHEPHEPGHANLVQSGCQWCADEDWPCSDMRHALNVARVALGGKREEL